MKNSSKRTRVEKLKLMVHFGRKFAEKVSDRYTAACAAQAAFFIMLSIVPIISLILVATTYLPFTQQDVYDLLMRVVPDEFSVYVIGVINDLYHGASRTVLSISIIAILWSASTGISALIDGFNSMYQLRQDIGFVKSKLVALVYTIVFIILFAVIMSVYVMVSHFYGEYIRDVLTSGSLLTDVLWFIRYILGWLLFYTFILMMYVVLPGGFGLPKGKEEHLNLGKRIKSQMPGAAFCSVAWLVISRLVMLYIQHFSSFSMMYGSLAGIVIMMLWLYLCMYSLFIGAVVNYLLSNGYLTRVKKMLQ